MKPKPALILALISVLLVNAVPGVVRGETVGENPAQKSSYLSENVVLQLTGQKQSPREVFLVALALQDTARAETVLHDRSFPPALASWHRARLAEAASDPSHARQQWEKAKRNWRRLRAKQQLMSTIFDREYVQGMLEAGAQEEARHGLDHPFASHRNDPLFLALEGIWCLHGGDVANAVLKLDAAWRQAGSVERQNRVFATRALAHLRGGDAFSACDAWFEYVEGLRGAKRRAWALRFWGEHPVLEEAVVSASARSRAAAWLAKQARREEALDLALAAWREDSGSDGRQGYVLGIEQLYRLRRHQELAALLRERRPEGLREEERAELAAIPWGVRRRQGATPEVAEGFESVVKDYAGTKRAVEALWEAAWMWELSGDTRRAEEAFLRYARENPGAPFARAAALRAVYLPSVRKDHALVLQRVEELSSQFGDGAEQASALWLGFRSAGVLGRQDEADALHSRLEKEHADSPFLGLKRWPEGNVGEGAEKTAPADSVSFEGLYGAQRRALEELAVHLGVKDLFDPAQEGWARARELLWWGFFDEGEQEIQRLVREGRHDAVSALRAVALAWSTGQAERQAREAWWLAARLKTEREEWGTRIDLVAYPTPFAAVVASAARENGLSPALLWALMRQESFYEAGVVSRAGAYGLLQLLPSTAEKMASQLHDSMPLAEEKLLDPRLNLRYGSAYLSELLKENEGDPYAALAAYNAGESNSRRWKTRMEAGDPPEELILRISYSETRDYVYRVLRAWKIYHRLYREPAP